MASGVSSSSGTAFTKSENGYEDPPILMAIPLSPPSVSSIQQVIIDDYDDMAILESTPLVATYSSSTTNGDTNPTSSDDATNDNGMSPKGEPEVVYRDWMFGVIFYLQLIVFILCAIQFSPRGYERLDKFFNYTIIRQKIQEENDDALTMQNLDLFESFANHASEYLDVHALRIFLWTIIPSGLLGVFWVQIIVLILPYISYGIVTATLLSTLIIATGLLIVWLALEPSLATLILAGFLCGT